ncbi:hypothetical protein CK733_06995 [Campylobacter upsaliensis]|nr:hypothetical protein [Campylobacter upsaliensis]
MRLEQFLDFRILDNGKYIEPSIDYVNGIINISFKVENKDLEIEIFSGRKDSEGNKIYGNKRIRKKEEEIRFSDEEFEIHKAIFEDASCRIYPKAFKEAVAYLIDNKIAKDLKEASSYITKAVANYLNYARIIAGYNGTGLPFDTYINQPNELIDLMEKTVLSLEYLNSEQLYNSLCYEVDKFNKDFLEGKRFSRQYLFDFFGAMQDKYEELKEYDLFYHSERHYNSHRFDTELMIASNTKNVYMGLYYSSWHKSFRFVGFAFYNPKQKNIFFSDDEDYIKEYHELLRKNKTLLS